MMTLTADNRIAADENLTDAGRAYLVKLAKGDDEMLSILAQIALRIDRLEQRVTDLMRRVDKLQPQPTVYGGPSYRG